MSPRWLILITTVLVATGCFDPPGLEKGPTRERLGIVDSEGKPIVKVETIEEGKGRGAEPGDKLAVHYQGFLTNAHEFDHNIGGDPFVFTLGQGKVIPGWEKGLVGIKVGERRRLTIPPELGYGVQGAPGKIPPNSVLVFEVWLDSFQ